MGVNQVNFVPLMQLTDFSQEATKQKSAAEGQPFISRHRKILNPSRWNRRISCAQAPIKWLRSDDRIGHTYPLEPWKHFCYEAAPSIVLRFGIKRCQC